MVLPFQAINNDPAHLTLTQFAEQFPFDAATGAWNAGTATAFSDSFSADTEARYSQLSSTDLASSVASAAGDVVVGGGVMTVSSDDDKKITAVLKSYKFESGQFEFSFDNNSDGGGGADACGLVFGYQDASNHYKLVVEDDTAGAENMKFYKVVAGVHTQLGSTKDISASYTRGGKSWIKVQIDVTRGQMWAWHRADAGSYSGAADISDAFSAQYEYGLAGFIAQVTTAGAGNLSVNFDDLTIRANLLIGRTNVPATETGWHFSDGFGVDSVGRLTTTGTWAVSGGVLSCTVAGNATFPFQTTIGTHQFTPTLADGTDYYYFGGYRLKFVASGGNSCVITLQTTAGVAQGTGSLTVTTTAGAFANPVVITESATSISVTVTGATGTISSGTTTSTNAKPKFTIGTATCSFDNYTFSGTRYYLSPILRGAQMGQYYTGSETVNATAYSDDFNWDTINEYTQVYRTWTVDTDKGNIYGDGSSALLSTKQQFGAGYYSTSFFYTSALSNIILLFGWNQASDGAGNPRSCYGIYDIGSTNQFQLIRFESDGTATSLGLASTSAHALNTPYEITAYWNPTTGEITGTLYSVSGSVISTLSAVDTTYTNENYAGIRHSTVGRDRSTSFRINALESTATDGVSITLGGVPHGARYDTAEEAYLSYTSTEQNGQYYGLTAQAITTDTANDDIEFYYANTTDGSSISPDGNTTVTAITAGTS